MESLAAAIAKAQAEFAKYHRKKAADKPTDIFAMLPSETCGLQVIDYYLWALQRMYERGEDRFFKMLSHRYSLIVDLDDRMLLPGFQDAHIHRNQTDAAAKRRPLLWLCRSRRRSS
jgi:hypothetical protein